ncbi:hypothetical protein WR51_05595 [Bacillus cereus]|nr:hypothetical protein WR47_05585 [Bacillus cereus]ANC12391.1 hypothetical protein WR51_05595 [Bacillus cereus]
MVSFRGTEGNKIIEKNSLGIPMKPGEGMKDLKTDTNHFVKKKFHMLKYFTQKRHLKVSSIDLVTKLYILY